MDKAEKERLIKKHSPKTRILKNSILAFLFGGIICGGGQIGFFALLPMVGDEGKTATLITLILIFIGSVLTGFGVFDRIARHAGAGTLVPVTGFSISPAFSRAIISLKAARRSFLVGALSFSIRRFISFFN